MRRSSVWQHATTSVSLLEEKVADLSIWAGRSCEGTGLIDARIIELPQDLIPCGADQRCRLRRVAVRPSLGDRQSSWTVTT